MQPQIPQKTETLKTPLNTDQETVTKKTSQIVIQKLMSSHTCVSISMLVKPWRNHTLQTHSLPTCTSHIAQNLSILPAHKTRNLEYCRTGSQKPFHCLQNVCSRSIWHEWVLQIFHKWKNDLQIRISSLYLPLLKT